MSRFGGVPLDDPMTGSRFGGVPVEEPQQEFPSLEQIQQEVKAEFPMEEAPIMAQVGRGMMDVYQGGYQLGLNTLDHVNRFKKVADKKIDEAFTPGTVSNKAAKTLMTALTQMSPVGSMSPLVGEDTTEQYNKQLSQELQRYNESNPDFQIARVAGSIATPLSLVPGGGASTFAGKIAMGSGTGTIFSMMQPVENSDEFFAEKGEQALWGAAIGGALPIAGKLLGVVKNWIDEATKPLYKSGVYRDVSKFLKETITENKEKITQSIARAIQSGDDRTVGQIIADSAKSTSDDFGGMLVRLEKDLSRQSDSLKSLYARQSATRRAFIDSLAKTDDDLMRAISAREQNGAANYTKAFMEKVRVDDDLKKILNNAYAKTAINDAQTLAQAKGTKSQTEFLHYVKIALDKQLGRTGDTALSRTEKETVNSIKQKLVGWMEKKNPLYQTARQQYQLDSLPINKMKVGQELRNKLVGALEDDKPSTYALALRNAPTLIKRSTGFDRYKGLDDIFSPDEVAGLKRIGKELAVEQKAKQMASASKGTMGELSTEVNLSLPAILSRPVVITNHILKRLGQDKSPEYKQVLATMMQNPDEFIRVYGGPSVNPKTKAAIDIVNRLNTLLATQQPARQMAEE